MEGLALYPFNDDLQGTDAGPRYNNGQYLGWSLKYDELEFDEFLFSTGDCTHWMVMKKSEVLPYGDTFRVIERSRISDTPYRGNRPADPWMTFTGHVAMVHCNSLYQEPLGHTSGCVPCFCRVGGCTCAQGMVSVRPARMVRLVIDMGV